MNKVQLSDEILKFVENNTEHIVYDDLQTLNAVWSRIFSSIPDEVQTEINKKDIDTLEKIVKLLRSKYDG
tara:strand:+ start:624 stop:833 length:210 start_codon:yes stop_codon:yes gene_type:complete